MSDLTDNLLEPNVVQARVMADITIVRARRSLCPSFQSRLLREINFWKLVDWTECSTSIGAQPVVAGLCALLAFLPPILKSKLIIQIGRQADEHVPRIARALACGIFCTPWQDLLPCLPCSTSPRSTLSLHLVQRDRDVNPCSRERGGIWHIICGYEKVTVGIGLAALAIHPKLQTPYPLLLPLSSPSPSPIAVKEALLQVLHKIQLFQISASQPITLGILDSWIQAPTRVGPDVMPRAGGAQPNLMGPGNSLKRKPRGRGGGHGAQARDLSLISEITACTE